MNKKTNSNTGLFKKTKHFYPINIMVGGTPFFTIFYHKLTINFFAIGNSILIKKLNDNKVKIVFHIHILEIIITWTKRKFVIGLFDFIKYLGVLVLPKIIL